MDWTQHPRALESKVAGQRWQCSQALLGTACLVPVACLTVHMTFQLGGGLACGCDLRLPAQGGEGMSLLLLPTETGDHIAGRALPPADHVTLGPGAWRGGLVIGTAIPYDLSTLEISRVAWEVQAQEGVTHSAPHEGPSCRQLLPPTQEGPVLSRRALDGVIPPPCPLCLLCASAGTQGG